jgi:hypothetical protein
VAADDLLGILKNGLFARSLRHSKMKNAHIWSMCCAFSFLLFLDLERKFLIFQNTLVFPGSLKVGEQKAERRPLF